MTYLSEDTHNRIVAEHTAEDTATANRRFAAWQRNHAAAGSLVRPNGYRTTAPAPADTGNGWTVVATDPRGGWEIVATGTLDYCTGQATARVNHPANRNTGRIFAVILSEHLAKAIPTPADNRR